MKWWRRIARGENVFFSVNEKSSEMRGEGRRHARDVGNGLFLSS